MTRTILTTAACAAALALAACGNNDGHVVNAGICADFKTTANQAAAPAATDASTPVGECVRRWAYSLAGGTDTADVVADAAVNACASALSQWNQASLTQPSAGDGVSLVTGQPSNPLAEHNTFARSRALLYVVEARAGHCAAPPVINGVPAGTSPL